MSNNLDFSPRQIILSEVKNLKPNEQKVIADRFGLEEDTKTLAAIGRELKLSRERIRQIERDGLRKLSIMIAKKHENFVKKIVATFEEHGGVITREDISERILSKNLSNSPKEKKALHLFITLLPDIVSIERHEELQDSWMLASMPKDEVIKILNSWANYLKKQKKPASIEIVLEAHPNLKKHKISFLSALPKVSKKIIETYEGTLGLEEWTEYNPKTVRDKIYYVLRKNQKPMHFSDIARAIEAEKFDNKKVVVATIHNELISDKRFVLIGRGVYALKEWGYESGTVKDIIKNILNNNQVLSFEDIFKKISKQRIVKKNTVLINLQTQKVFKKVGKDKYALA